MQTYADELVRIEHRLRDARGYSEGYGKLLHHSARKVLAASGLDLPDERRPIPIDEDAVEDQIRRFLETPGTGRRPRSSTATNYAENWRRFARWVRDYLRAEAAGDAELYLHKLGRRAPKRSRRVASEAWDAPSYALAMEPPAMLRSDPRASSSSARYSYPAASADLGPDDVHVVTVKTSFGPYRLELPRSLSAEDAARIARAVLRLVD